MYCTNSLLKSEGGISTYQVIERVHINGAYIKKYDLLFTLLISVLLMSQFHV
jgi:hypothetical protein